MSPRQVAVLCGAALALGACNLLLRPNPTSQTPYVRFSHARHVPAGAPARSCGPCHSGPETLEQVPAAHPACASCHEIGRTPGAECLFCHSSRSPGARPVRSTRVFSFTHTAHRFSIVDATTCEPCHRMQGRQIVTPVTEAACVSCHVAQNAPTDCTSCHVGLSRIPPSHEEAGFLREHGRLEQTPCLRCHARSFCSDCHTRDHTPLWKRATHGIDAVRDTRACASCHEADECDRCHRTVRPTNHLGGNWQGLGHAMPARISSRSCVTCHSADDCARCHAP